VENGKKKAKKDNGTVEGRRGKRKWKPWEGGEREKRTKTDK